jgi:hypothetical protein
MQEVSRCKNMVRDYKTNGNEQFMDQLLDEIPSADLEG